MSPAVNEMCMKCYSFYSCRLLWLVLLTLASCGKLGEGDDSRGQLSVFFTGGSELLTKAYANLPDTNDFKLKIKDSSGKTVYEGAYGDCPEVIEVRAGNYTVIAESSEFSKPMFDAPQFGDEQCVSISAGGSARVLLDCAQMNCGMRLSLSESFRSAYSDAVLFLKSSSGNLMYSFAEKRTAYFLPGSVSVMMSQGGKDEVIMVKDLKERDMVTVTLSAPVSQTGASGCGVAVSLDTTRVWLHEDLVVGGASSGTQESDAMTVSDAVNAVGSEDVWVTGYIVGGDLTSASASFDPPFKSQTNLLLGPRSTVTDRTSCLSVQLPDNQVREALNLVGHPELIGKRVAVKGDIVASYFGLCGVKNTVEYVLY
ncbi:MAG: DUF4493 domain-containing protein [Bacteroidales bacterium]|nr:DUF4493 domain-containing protein [Bacteroidales bacterium]